MRGEFRRGHVIQTAVGMFFIVFVAPGFYHLLSVSAVQKHVHVQTFVAKSVMETFNIRVFPRAARRDVDGFGAALGKPGLQGFSRQLGTVVRANVPRRAVDQEEPFERCDHLGRPDRTLCSDAQGGFSSSPRAVPGAEPESLS